MKRLATIVSTLLVGLALSVGCPGQSSGAAIGSQLSNAKARAHRVPQSLPTLGAYNVDWSNVIVAGVSSGAGMATPIFDSHSSKVKGEATFAGSPFFCAQDNAYNALYLCAGTEYGPVPVGTLESDTNNASCTNMDCVS